MPDRTGLYIGLILAVGWAVAIATLIAAYRTG